MQFEQRPHPIPRGVRPERGRGGGASWCGGHASRKAPRIAGGGERDEEVSTISGHDQLLDDERDEPEWALRRHGAVHVFHRSCCASTERKACSLSRSRGAPNRPEQARHDVQARQRRLI